MKQDDPTFVEIGKRWSLNGIRIVRQDEMYGNTIYGFIHRMRNALAHANFTFQGEDLEIWNCHSSGREVYRAYIPRSVVLSFLDVVGVLMVNSMQRSTH